MDNKLYLLLYMSDYYTKYLKYKSKYLALKYNIIGGNIFNIIMENQKIQLTDDYIEKLINIQNRLNKKINKMDEISRITKTTTSMLKLYELNDFFAYFSKWDKNENKSALLSFFSKKESLDNEFKFNYLKKTDIGL